MRTAAANRIRTTHDVLTLPRWLRAMLAAWGMRPSASERLRAGLEVWIDVLGRAGVPAAWEMRNAVHGRLRALSDLLVSATPVGALASTHAVNAGGRDSLRGLYNLIVEASIIPGLSTTWDGRTGKTHAVRNLLGLLLHRLSCPGAPIAWKTRPTTAMRLRSVYDGPDPIIATPASLADWRIDCAAVQAFGSSSNLLVENRWADHVGLGEIMVVSHYALPGGFDLVAARLAARLSALGEWRVPGAGGLPVVSDWDYGRRWDGRLTATAEWRWPAGDMFYVISDLDARTLRRTADAPFLCAVRRPEHERLTSDWGLEYKRRIETGPAVRLDLRPLHYDALVSVLNDPARQFGLFNDWHGSRQETKDRLASWYEAQLREYAFMVPGFNAAWASNHIPNASYRYAMLPDGQRVYGYFARPWVGWAERHDNLRDIVRDRLAALAGIHVARSNDLCGASWVLDQARLAIGPVFMYDVDNGLPGAGRLFVWWDQRPFGAIQTGIVAQADLLTPAGIHLVARNLDTGEETALGFIPEDDLEDGHGLLVDVALPDGEYEMEARVSSMFWPGARSGAVSTYRLEAGKAPERQLPGIVDLRAALTPDYWRVLEWSVAAGEADVPGYALGIWFGDDKSVDIQGPPAVTLPRTPEIEHYGHYFQQSAPIHAAVAAFTPEGGRGQPAEVFLDWSSERPESPEHQWAEENDAAR